MTRCCWGGDVAVSQGSLTSVQTKPQQYICIGLHIDVSITDINLSESALVQNQNLHIYWIVRLNFSNFLVKQVYRHLRFL